jgi:hypothetical protein
VSELVTCAAAYCRHPHGPVQPVSNFARRNGKRNRTCRDCREHASAKQRERRAQSAGRPRLTDVAPSVADIDPAYVAPSVADIDPAYAARLRRWLLGLVIRREGHPLTREIGQAGSASDDGSRVCSVKSCYKTHRTKYKLCPDCREIKKQRMTKRRAAAKERERDEQSINAV